MEVVWNYDYYVGRDDHDDVYDDICETDRIITVGMLTTRVFIMMMMLVMIITHISRSIN